MRLSIADLPGDPYLSRQSGTRVVHGRSSGGRSAFGGHVEGAAMGLLGVRVSLGLGGRVCPGQLGGGTTGCHLVTASKSQRKKRFKVWQTEINGKVKIVLEKKQQNCSFSS